MSNHLFLLVGKSASGKTTIANILEEQYGYKQVNSYTTRKPRYDGESGHIFVSKEEFDGLGELAAYTFYNGNEYGTTFEQLAQCDIYVIDPAGVDTLLDNKNKINRMISIIYFDANVYNRINRMINRGDSDMAIISRLLNDEQNDWGNKLWDIVDKHSHNHLFFCADANKPIEKVLDEVLYLINHVKGGRWNDDLL